MSALIPFVMPWLIMSVAVVPVMIIANSVFPPVSMVPFPSVEAFQPPRFTTQPDIARPQIEIGSAYQADVFVTVPVIIVGNFIHHHDRRRRVHNHSCPETHPPIRLNNAPGNEHQYQSREAGNPQRNASYFPICFHAIN